jgi:ubiquinone/menaquinone biosynthesis C-methylase UbiE
LIPRRLLLRYFRHKTGQSTNRSWGAGRLAPLLIGFGGLADGDRVLDVGCGTGSVSYALPEAANIAAVTGVDQAKVYLEYARRRSADPRFTFRHADARALPFPDGSFDARFPISC